MAFLAAPRAFSRAAFKAHVKSLKFPLWKPKFVVLHNTASPNLVQWLGGPTKPAQRIENLNGYYKSLGWHAGPHLFIDPGTIWEACDLEHDGVHCSCDNHVSIGIEMVGDYHSEEFNSGPGAKVRDLAVYAMAVLHRKFGWDPAHYVHNICGLHFHRECFRDHHACPGDKVIKAEVVAAVVKEMEALS